jgi:hypothetical protein
VQREHHEMAQHQHDPKCLSSAQGFERPPVSHLDETIVRTFRSSLLAMRLHRNVCVQMVKGAIGLLTSIPATFVHALNFFISPTWPLVLLRTWDWNKGVNGGKRMSSLQPLLAMPMQSGRARKPGHDSCAKTTKVQNLAHLSNEIATEESHAHLPLVVVERERPWQAQGDQMMQDGHNACLAGGTGLPIQGVTRRLGSEDAQGNAACRDVVCRASTVVDESMLGSSRRRLMDL